MARRDFDERDARVRPARSTRPRSKDRPDYSSANQAFVTSVERGRYLCLTEEGAEITAMKARELGKNAIVVGDRVGVVGDVSGNPGSLARIVTVLPRKNSLSRTIDDGENLEKTIAANLDQMMIVVSIADPEPRTGFVDRCLAVAFDQGINPILVVTKCDLKTPDDFLENYQDLAIQVFTSKKGGDTSEIFASLHNKTTVLIGHSGVGKSTLVNALTGDTSRRTGDVNLVTGRGRHTSSSALAQKLSNSGWIIDTPGVRSFGLDHVEVSRIIASFHEFDEVVANCPKNCSHDEAGCALNSYRESHPESAGRIDGLRRVLASRNQPIT